MASLWQHKVPVGFLEGDGHNASPISTWNADKTKFTYRSPTKCRRCGKAIKRVDPNEGPEGLKALFRF